MVVLSMITKDSLTRTNKLGEVLESTRQIPYKLFVLVDNSSDGTARFVLDHLGDKEVVVLRGGETRAAARQMAINYFLEHTDDKWLMFVDDDAVLNPGWWDYVVEHELLKDGVGEVWGINYDIHPLRIREFKNLPRRPVMQILANPDLRVLTEKVVETLSKYGLWHVLQGYGITSLAISYLIYQFSVRGGTHDTVFNRDALEGIPYGGRIELPDSVPWMAGATARRPCRPINIPSWLHVYEDAFLHHYVRCSGYASVINPIGVLHYHIPPEPGSETAKRQLEIVIRAMFEYGIAEYENVLAFGQTDLSIASVVKQMLGLVRPLVGYVYYIARGMPFSYVHKRQMDKLRFRAKKLVATLQYMRKYGLKSRLPEPCQAIRRRHCDV